MAKNIKEFLNLNNNNIILGKSQALLSFINAYDKDRENNVYDNKLLILPYGTYHHTNYEFHFKGMCAEYENVLIITQNKEFLETCIMAEKDPLDVVSYDFNIVQVSFDTDTNEFIVNTITKEEAKKLLEEHPSYEFRDF